MTTGVAKKGMVLPFIPLAMSFDLVNYYVDIPPVRSIFLCSLVLEISDVFIETHLV